MGVFRSHAQHADEQGADPGDEEEIGNGVEEGNVKALRLMAETFELRPSLDSWVGAPDEAKGSSRSSALPCRPSALLR
jgi:hypothetical protein